jgi:hypothetical protein
MHWLIPPLVLIPEYDMKYIQYNNMETTQGNSNIVCIANLIGISCLSLNRTLIASFLPLSNVYNESISN